MITEDYVSFEVAKLLKEKGFDDLCIFKYNSEGMKVKAGNAIDEWSNTELEEDEYSAPTHQMAMKWLREAHKIVIVIDAYHADHWERYIDCFEINIYSHASTMIVPNEIAHHTDYTEAVEAALKYSLEKLI